jgi:hypothetical protein
MGELGFPLDGEVNLHTLRLGSPMPDVNGVSLKAERLGGQGSFGSGGD